jgi:molybdopterin-guanine dinucleotide biosynthesis protein A
LVTEVRAVGVTDVLLVANDPEAYRDVGLPTVPDLRSGLGPLAGIEAALTHFQDREGLLLLACDLPSITRSEIAVLLTAFHQNGRRLVVARTGSSFWHPLCSVVHNGLCKAVTAALDEGRLSVHRLWEALGAKSVDFADETPFTNVNSPAEWAAALAGETMTASLKICSSERWRQRLQAWAQREGVSLELGTEEEEGLRVTEPEGRQPADLKTLCVGGWIACELGHELAGRIGVPEKKLAGLLDVLDIRVRKCQLGCF